MFPKSISFTAFMSALHASVLIVVSRSQVRPPRAWRELLLAPEATAWLTALLPRLSAESSQQAAASPLAAAARQLLVRLCAVGGDIFVPAPPGR